MTKRSFKGNARVNWCACLTGGFAITGLALAALPNHALLQAKGPETRKSTENPLMCTGKLSPDIFLAIDHRDVKALEALLAQGGDPNSRNGLNFAPLYIAAASHQPDAVDALLKAGAKPDAPSTYGTPLMFACATNNAPDAMRFLSLGANASYQRTDGMTPLMMASNADAIQLVKELIKRKVDVNVQDDGGYSALSLAARNGWLDVATALAGAGANLEAADENGETPLMIAAMTGHADVVKMLIEKGAKVNAVDNSGRTALLLASSYGDFPEVTRALLDGKADASAKDKDGHTAGWLVSTRGYGGCAALLVKGASMPVASLPTPREAVTRSLDLIQTATKQFAEGAPCVSCHQEGLGRMATGEAAAKGFKIDAAVDGTEKAKILGMLMGLKPLNEGALHSPEVMKQIPLIEINEVNTAFTWVLSGLIDQNQPASDATAAMTMVLARQQSPDGCWTFSLPRVPMQSSFFTFTALSARALSTYGPKSDADEVAQRLAKAKEWFMVAPAKTSEDRASKLLGLKWSGGDDSSRQKAAEEIIADQRPDGGWSQMPGQQSDAYATGQALYALRVGNGMAANDPVYKKGVDFLLRTQDKDGSWFVYKRAIPANNYFDAGFPHGESQYASFNGTCWATLALLGAVDSIKG